MFLYRSVSILLIILSIITFTGLDISPAYAQTPEIVGKAGVLIDSKSGEVLYDKNAHIQLPPASTTKVLTAAIALQKGDLTDKVTISKRASMEEGSSIYLREGEVLTLEELIWAVLLNSGNGSAVAIAEHISGSVESFVDLMNEQAREWGAVNSHFNNPNGLPDDEHYTTAYDLSIIAKHAMEIPLFRKMVSTQVKEIARENPESLNRLINHNDLLWDYQGAIGVKTGYTIAAKHCLVSAAKRGDQEFIAVVLGSIGNDVYKDSIKLLDYGFENYKTLKLTSQDRFIGEVNVTSGTEPVRAVTEMEKYYTVKLNDDSKPTEEITILKGLKASIQKGQKVGYITYTLKGKKIAKIYLVAENSVDEVAILERQSWILPTVATGVVLLFIRSFLKRIKKRRTYRRIYRRRRRGRFYKSPLR